VGRADQGGDGGLPARGGKRVDQEEPGDKWRLPASSLEGVDRGGNQVEKRQLRAVLGVWVGLVRNGGKGGH
jgi:hypothetical protein